MNLDDVLREFAEAGNNLPRDSMQWALDHWDETAPPLVQMLDDYVTGRDRSEDVAETLFFGLHLAGQKQETLLFPGLCRLLHDAEAAQRVFGEAITETLRGILVGTYDGNLAALKAVIDNTATDDFIRDTALLVVAYLTRIGRVTEAEMREYLTDLHDRLDLEIDDILMAGWIMTIAYLGFEDLVPRVEALYQLPAMQYPLIESDEFHDKLAQTLADPSSMAGFDAEHVRPLTDVIAELSAWASFSGEDDEADELFSDEDELSDEDWAALLPEVPRGEPLLNPMRHVGRNDPCPCGSGKKYKKCCLA